MSFTVPCRYWGVCRTVCTLHPAPTGAENQTGTALSTMSPEGSQVPTSVLMQSQNYVLLFHSSHVQDSLVLNYVYTEVFFSFRIPKRSSNLWKKVSQKESFMAGTHIYVVMRTFVEGIHSSIEIFPYHDLKIHLLKSRKVVCF